MFSCTSTTWPTSATHNNCPATLLRLDRHQYLQWSSSCTHLQLDQHQLPTTIIQRHTSTTWPTSATRNNQLAGSLRFDHTSYRHHPSSWRHKYYYNELYTRTCKHDNKLSPLLYLLPRLCFLHCLSLSLLARLT